MTAKAVTEMRLPKGWSVETNSDGTTRVRLPRGSGGFLQLSDFLCPGVRTDILFDALFAVVPLSIWLLWRLLGQEEWYVGPQFLEVRQAFLGSHSQQRCTDAALAAEERTFGRWALLVEAQGRQWLLAIGNQETIRALGTFLAEQMDCELRLPRWAAKAGG